MHERHDRTTHKADIQPSLGTILKLRREELKMSYRQLESTTRIPKTQLYRLEQDTVQKPTPEHLLALAGALDVPLSDLYIAAGLPLPRELPTFTPYLRSKYRHLPSEAHDEISAAFEQIASKYGYDPTGPKPGEDET